MLNDLFLFSLSLSACSVCSDSTLKLCIIFFASNQHNGNANDIVDFCAIIIHFSTFIHVQRININCIQWYRGTAVRVSNAAVPIDKDMNASRQSACVRVCESAAKQLECIIIENITYERYKRKSPQSHRLLW